MIPHKKFKTTRFCNHSSLRFQTINKIYAYLLINTMFKVEIVGNKHCKIILVQASAQSGFLTED